MKREKKTINFSGTETVSIFHAMKQMILKTLIVFFVTVRSICLGRTAAAVLI